MINNMGEARRRYALATENGKFTQKDAARHLGVSLATLKAWEQGATESFRGEHLCAMADLYEVSIDYLLCHSKTPQGAIAASCIANRGELEVINCYRTLREDGQDVFRKLAYSLVEGKQFATARPHVLASC